MKSYSFALAVALTVAAPALAQDAPATEINSIGNIDTERLEEARFVAGRLFPDGTYARMMASMDGLMDSMMGQMMQMPMADMMRMGGATEGRIKNLPKASIKEMMIIMDPAFEKRTSIVMKTVMGEMGQIMTPLEPGIREGLAQSYAKRFTTRELADLNRFFATPTGSAYASDYMMLMMDPAVTGKMMEFVPALTQAMPVIAEKMKLATADLPKPKSYNQLTAAERARLAEILGVPEAQLGKKRGK